jgi:hypothetical protein
MLRYINIFFLDLAFGRGRFLINDVVCFKHLPSTGQFDLSRQLHALPWDSSIVLYFRVMHVVLPGFILTCSSTQNVQF